MSMIAISDLAAPPVARSAPLSSELLADIAAGLAGRRGALAAARPPRP